ncbi:hypothetical protein Syun_023015 [Stephania yunnanensis]|uniref:Uncharacterized protein n=1 Tax=Stephania yunnanensis TaxID=152371 RepID=A0AAP0FMI8_9MAGN
MNVPADDGGLLKPDVVEGTDDEVPYFFFLQFSDRRVLVFPIVLEGLGGRLGGYSGGSELGGGYGGFGGSGLGAYRGESSLGYSILATESLPFNNTVDDLREKMADIDNHVGEETGPKEDVEEIYLPEEISTHSDAMSAFQPLQKPDALCGRDRSAQFAFSQSIHPSGAAVFTGLYLSVKRHFKETKFRRRHLEQENQDLLKSLKEFLESQIQEFLYASSLKKLPNKLRSLEQIHKECSANLRAREVEWDLQMEGLLHIVEEKDKIADDLKQQIVVLDEELMRTETEVFELGRSWKVNLRKKRRTCRKRWKGKGRG